MVVAAAMIVLGLPSSASSATLIGCNGFTDDVEWLHKPRFCNPIRPGQTLSEGVGLQRLQWTGWGNRSATAVGRAKRHVYDRGQRNPWLKVRVRVDRRVWCAELDGYVYTRLRVTTRDGRRFWRLEGC